MSTGADEISHAAPIHRRYQVYINYYGRRSETINHRPTDADHDEGISRETGNIVPMPMLASAGESFDW